MINFDQHLSKLNSISKKVYALWNNAIYIQIADLLKDSEQLRILDDMTTATSKNLSQIRKEFSSELDRLPDDEFESLEDKIESVEDLISKLEYRIMSIEWIVIYFDKVLEKINDSKYSNDLASGIQEIPESITYIKINRLS